MISLQFRFIQAKTFLCESQNRPLLQTHSHIHFSHHTLLPPLSSTSSPHVLIKISQGAKETEEDLFMPVKPAGPVMRLAENEQWDLFMGTKGGKGDRLQLVLLTSKFHLPLTQQLIIDLSSSRPSMTQSLNHTFYSAIFKKHSFNKYLLNLWSESCFHPGYTLHLALHSV